MAIKAKSTSLACRQARPSVQKRRILFSFLFLAVVFSFSFCALRLAYAVRVPPPADVNVTARVGEFTLNLYGFISPFASLVLSSKNTTMKGTVATKNGDFSFVGVPIRRGFSEFCLEAIDFHMLGDSYTCFTIPPATATVTKKNIFLPPTLGLSRTEVRVGQKVFAFGYTMPGSEVQLHVNHSLVLRSHADGTGYYIFDLTPLGAGQYSLFATATYKGKDSLAPSRVLHLHTMNWWEWLIALIKELLKKLWDLLTSLGLGPLWIGIPLVFLITFLIMKLWPERFTFIYNSRMVKWLANRRQKPLHHAWFVGY